MLRGGGPNSSVFGVSASSSLPAPFRENRVLILHCKAFLFFWQPLQGGVLLTSYRLFRSSNSLFPIMFRVRRSSVLARVSIVRVYRYLRQTSSVYLQGFSFMTFRRLVGQSTNKRANSVRRVFRPQAIINCHERLRNSSVLSTMWASSKFHVKLPRVYVFIDCTISLGTISRTFRHIKTPRNHLRSMSLQGGHFRFPNIRQLQDRRVRVSARAVPRVWNRDHASNRVRHHGPKLNLRLFRRPGYLQHGYLHIWRLGSSFLEPGTMRAGFVSYTRDIKASLVVSQGPSVPP